MRDSSFAHAQKESDQTKFPHGLLEFCTSATFAQGRTLPFNARIERPLSLLIALSLCGSIISAAPSSTTTICFIAVAGILLVGGHLNTVALHQAQPLQTIFYTIYFLIPHLEWFDIRDLVVYDWKKLIPWGYLFQATLYAATYTGLFLLLTWIGFRRKSLNT